jgi:hypothetical protein
MAEGDTLLNALVGAVVSVVVSFVPFSPVLGGAVAGYLQAGDSSDGLRVGAVAGFLAGIPILVAALALAFVLGFVGFGAMTMDPQAGAGTLLFAVFGVVATLLGALYTVGLSAAGGWLGNYVATDTDLLD